MDQKVIEVNEAINAGHIVLNNIDDVTGYLQDAKLWGLFDMFSDHSLLSGIVKHSKLDKAQDKLEELKNSLVRFNNELNDVKVYCNVDEVVFDGFMKVFDILFDNFFVDIYAISKISESKEKMQELRYQVTSVINNLESIK